MRDRQESQYSREHQLSDPTSCLNTARKNERLFVLLARDIAAPDTIRYWVRKRLALGKNRRDDAQIVEALDRHLCRCGAHPRIVRAIEKAASQGASA